MTALTRPAGAVLVFLSLLSWLPVRAGASAQEEYTRDWKRLESEHFVLVGNAGDGAIRRVAGHLEEFRGAVLAAMPGLTESYEIDTTVVVFRHEAAFRPFRPDDDVAGYFTTGPSKNYIALVDDVQHVIYHEYVHQLTRSARDWPAWLREGMAEFYSTLEVRNGGRSVLLGRAIAEHIAWLERAFVPLGEFLDPRTRFESDAMIRTLYSEGWALYHYIQLGRPELAPGLGRFIRLMASPDGDVASNVQAAFGRDLGSLESDFMTYARNTLRFPAAEKTLAQRLPEVETSRPVEIPESEASFYLGDLLLHLQGPDDDARLYLERSLELGGEFEPALTALYVLNDRQGNDAEAAEFLNRALAAPDAGYLPHLLRARKALVEEPFEEVAAEAETHLRFVVSRRPELPDGHYWLGQLLMRRPEMFEEGIRELETAVETSGADPQMRLAYARALWVSGNDLRAQGLLMGLAQTTADPAVQVEVRRLQEEISRLTAARAASEDQELQARAAAQQPFPASPEPRSTEPPRSTPPASPTLTGSTIPRPILPEGMSSIEGRISYIGCLDAFQLVIVSAEGTLRLSAPGLANIELASYSPAVRGEMPCGDIEPALPARVIYRPAADPASGVDGEPVRVDFLP